LSVAKYTSDTSYGTDELFVNTIGVKAVVAPLIKIFVNEHVVFLVVKIKLIVSFYFKA
jgi:hypothetical protein